jgi:hypothetical protein
MAETLILDPPEVAINRTAFDITAYVSEDGPDFGDAAIEQYLADVQLGQLPVDYRVPNRTITIPLLLTKGVGSLTFDQIRARVQQKTGLFQREGGWIKRQTSIGPLFADVVGATLKLGGSSAQALWSVDADAVLTLTALPDWYGNEVAGSVVTAASGAADLSIVVSGITGNHPARARVTLSELDSKQLNGLFWGVRSRHYDAAATARLAYEAEALTLISPWFIDTTQPPMSGNQDIISRGSLSPAWQTVLSTDIASVGPMTHVGSYRVWARMTVQHADAQARFVWDVGDLTNPTPNPPALVDSDAVAPNLWMIVDLGEIRIDPSPIGSHRWRGAIQVRDAGLSTTRPSDFGIDKIWFQPLDESAGLVTTSNYPTFGLSGFSALDGFDQTAGVLTGKSSAIGGVWTFGTGDTDDFTVDATTHRAVRNTASDTAPRVNYVATPTLSVVAAQVDLLLGSPLSTSLFGGGMGGVLLRWVDANNFAYVLVYSQPDYAWYEVHTKVAGVDTPVATNGIFTQRSFWNSWYTVTVVANAAGVLSAWLYPQGSTPDPTPIFSITSSVLATGGVLATGKVGIVDYKSTADVASRSYDNFIAWRPDVDAVMYPTMDVELRHDGVYRESADGSYFAPLTPVGDLLRLPPAGLEGRSAELLLKASESIFGVTLDKSISRISAQVRYRPSYLFVPES